MHKAVVNYTKEFKRCSRVFTVFVEDVKLLSKQKLISQAAHVLQTSLSGMISTLLSFSLFDRSFHRIFSWASRTRSKLLFG